jgi:hypothetical protein
MSRSFKKTPISKATFKGAKSISNKIMRKKDKIAIKKAIEKEEEPILELSKLDGLNSYDICDNISICDGDCYCIAKFGRKKCLNK